jgi:hypothetical protein
MLPRRLLLFRFLFTGVLRIDVRDLLRSGGSFGVHVGVAAGLAFAPAPPPLATIVSSEACLSSRLFQFLRFFFRLTIFVRFMILTVTYVKINTRLEFACWNRRINTDGHHYFDEFLMVAAILTEIRMNDHTRILCCELMFV